MKWVQIVALAATGLSFVCVSLCLEEMARPDWLQKAKHLVDTRRVAERERLL